MLIPRRKSSARRGRPTLRRSRDPGRKNLPREKETKDRKCPLKIAAPAINGYEKKTGVETEACQEGEIRPVDKRGLAGRTSTD